MSDYHDYIYDLGARRIVGDFEGAYANVDDVWPSQHDVHILKFRTVRRIAQETGGRVLDIGAGYGDFVADLAAAGVAARGVEISPTAVARGIERHPGIDLRVGDLRSGLPFADASHDIVVLFGVMWYLLDSVDACLREIRRVLRPGGLLAASLSMPEGTPIGSEVIGSYDDFVAILQRHFSVRETLLCHGHNDLRAGLPLSRCRTDMVALCVADDPA